MNGTYVWETEVAGLDTDRLKELLLSGWEPLNAYVDAEGCECVFLRRQTFVAGDDRTAPCGRCEKPVVWLPTRKGKQCAVEPETVAATDVMYDPTKHASHFDTCAPLTAAEKEARKTKRGADASPQL